MAFKNSKVVFPLLLLVLLSASGFAQNTATVTGNYIDPTSTAVTSRTAIDVELKGANGNQCKVSGTGVLVPYKQTFTPQQISAGISLIKNSVISCGTTTGQSTWLFTVKRDGVPQPGCSLQITANTNLNNTACLNATQTPTTTVPTSSLFALIDGSNAGFTGSISAPSASLSGLTIGQRPFIDPTSLLYGAVCNGSTDDTTAMNAAAAFATSIGGSIALPEGKTCVIATSSSPALNLDETVNVAIIGGVAGGSASRPGGGFTVSPVLLFTGTPAIGIGARGSSGFSLKRVVVRNSNASFTGNLVDTSHFPGDTRCGGIACDSESAVIENSTFLGTASVARLLNFDKTISSRVVGNTFGGGLVQLGGAADSSAYSNQIQVTGSNTFIGASGTTAMIQNPGEAWDITGNTFELNGMIAGNTAVGCTSGFLDAKGTSFRNNWLGDNTGTPAITYVNVCGSGFDLSANLFSANNANATLVSLSNFVANFHARANSMCGGIVAGTAFALGSNDVVDIKEDACAATFTNFLTGTPLAGSIVTDPTGNTTFYGPVTLAGTSNTIKNATLTGASNGNAVTLLNNQGVTGTLTGNAADQTVYTFTIPANTLAAGKGVRITAGLSHSSGTGSVTYKVFFGASAIINVASTATGAILATTTVMNNPGSTSGQRSAGLLTSSNAVLQSIAGNAPGEDTTGAVVVKFTFNAANTEQVIGAPFIVELIQ